MSLPSSVLNPDIERTLVAESAQSGRRQATRSQGSGLLAAARHAMQGEVLEGRRTRYATLHARAAIVDPTELNQLMARLGEGDRSAFPAVFRELWPRVRAFCASLVPSADAEDAAQQAMEKILTRAAQYDPDRPALAWALAIAAWESRTVARWRYRRREIGGDAVSTASEQCRTEDSAEDVFIAHELQRAALLALGHLSESDRAELVRAYWEESNAGAPAARKRRQRAIQRLRGMFRRLYGTD